jgi:C-terminal processing protease CtpA/Prc
MNLLRVSAFLLLTLLGLGRLAASDTGNPGEDTHRMAGIGVIVGNDVPGAKTIHDHLIIRYVVDDSPAMKQGLHAGDEITAIDDTKLAGRNFAEAVNMRLRGPLDSIVAVTIRREGQKPFTVPFVRKVVPMPKDAPRL